MNIYSKKRSFIDVQCLRCKEWFPRDSELYAHLTSNGECLKSMGGGISGAKKLVKKMKDRKRNADSSQTRMALYKAYPKPKKKAE